MRLGLSWLFLTFLSFLAFSSIVTSLSTFFLSEDLRLLMGAPIPGIAYAPLFLLWFGLGDVSAVLLVGFVSAFPIVFNTWTGVKAVKEVWVRSALAMGADDRRLFHKVILPGALPYILTGLRLGLAQAWRILVGVEMLAAVPWGLGWMIFGAREFLMSNEAVAPGPMTFALAETYDPIMLAIWQTQGMVADPNKAKFLYAKALELGYGRARQRLEWLSR